MRASLDFMACLRGRQPKLEHELMKSVMDMQNLTSLENFIDGTKKIIEEVPISKISAMVPSSFDSAITKGLSEGSTQEDTTIMKAKIVTSSIHSQVEGSQSNPSTMTIRESSIASVQEGPELEKVKKVNLLTCSQDFKPQPMEDNYVHSDVIPSQYHYKFCLNDAGPSPTLDISDIFQLVELKDGESTLLAKALEIYPQLRLSCEQRTHRIIAFSYRVLVDILVMLATKTPCTFTALDRTTLEENLGAVNFLGFDKDWLEFVRAKVFGVDKSHVLVVEEEMLLIETELETCDVALERIQKKRIEAKGQLAIMQNEFEAIDTQLFDLLEHRKKLANKIAEFRKTIRAKDRPFGII
ncbi:uncharacterized protein LOC129318650 [Prosopis cineraria]|uniref:uncharacterized protein LOC129318650 n=1 Tax=Prosopis cineraria TaxID=364024 RepID=UPI0024102B39|nr:uncharacterized protein LOC129318650 [Prosopis cineraria]XP_054819515.1 uncharacterized protein LOC129318650 [Prosopis cineraria]XP_054819516.1 uncharacterized protein LOC129318650 [Prosopis cineraria]